MARVTAEQRIEALRAALEDYARPSATRPPHDWDRQEGYGKIARDALRADNAMKADWQKMIDDVREYAAKTLPQNVIALRADDEAAKR